MRILALDVDGVLLDPERGGLGNWTAEMEHEFGIAGSQIQQAFFQRSFDVVLATNQEHRRAGFLRLRLGAMMSIDDVLYSADLGVQKHEVAFRSSGTRGTRGRLDPKGRATVGPVSRQSDRDLMAMFF